MNIKNSKYYKNWLEKNKESKQRNYSFESASGEKVDSVYYPDDSDTYIEKLNFPGEFPYTRGIHPNMYRGKLWTMRQFAGFGSPEESNDRF